MVADPKTQPREFFSFQLTRTITNKDLMEMGGDPIRTAFKVVFLQSGQDSIWAVTGRAVEKAIVHLGLWEWREAALRSGSG